MSFRKKISYVLFPLTMWYAVGVRFRNVLYALGIRKQTAPHVTTIGVGNLSTGGSGKTPHVEYLLRLLSERYATAMLSRGYRRRSKGFQLDDGSHDTALLGDEAAMVARKFPQVQVAVCEKRVEGVRRLMELADLSAPDDDPSAVGAGKQGPTLPPQLIILDDVFQHRAIKPSINILLTEFRHPFYNDHILPYGDLREFKSARFRAGIVIVTKCPPVLNPVDRHNIVQDLGLQNYQKVFFSYLTYGALRRLDGSEASIDLRRVDSVLVVTGIAHPEPMVAELKRQTRVQHLAFADHHEFSNSDLVRIKSVYEALPGNSKLIVTTEKDAQRLRGKDEGLPLFVLPVEVAFHKQNDQDFDALIESSVRENISFLSKLSIWS
ncbi:MAG: tetraacyldisaccharide 4'-kinase [Bacteroidales bacterium]|nr:tetraacyldisaccharide 4'-kinase [Bacteroidales bacterium]